MYTLPDGGGGVRRCGGCMYFEDGVCKQFNVKVSAEEFCLEEREKQEHELELAPVSELKEGEEEP